MEKNKKKSVTGVLWAVLVFCIGAGSGILVALYLDLSFLDSLDPRMKFLAYVLMIVLIWLGYQTQVILHEAGHLVFGLLSGYRFSSFRVGRLMLVRQGGKWKQKRFFLAGTGGQCLMIPPKDHAKNPPVTAFLLGGCIFNLIFGAISLAVAILISNVFFAMLYFGVCGIVGLLSAVLNGIPLRTGMVVNDGANVIEMRRDPEAAVELCRHLLINAQSVEGVRLSEMPAEWFEMPTAEQKRVAVFAERAVFACNRLMDEERFDDATREIRALLESDAAVMGVHRKLLLCDLLFCELIGARRVEVIGELYTREQYQFMRSMREFPSVMRTEYAYAKLYLHDGTKAKSHLDAFQRRAATYPNEGDIRTERALIKIAKNTTTDL